MQTWREKARRDGEPVRLAQQDLTTRDIGLRLLNVLKIGTTLNFTLSTNRPGYVTALNLGTSGKFWLLCPSSVCTERAYVEPGRVYPFPGAELFPFQGDLAEMGPPGKEHLAVLISKKPLINALGVSQSQLREPINEIHAEALTKLTLALDATPGDWTAGVLSFDVEWCSNERVRN